jgi:1-acyl-sn-glycerol-3-phosphate acyltransferase
MKFISAIVVFSIKFVTRLLYRTEVTWHTPLDQMQWEDVRLAIVLNHTSLFEFLYISALPNVRLWRAIKRVVLPIADVTLQRPLTGLFFRAFVPNAVPITRKRDETWERFVAKVRDPESLMLIFPEGRMKRKDGLDKHGKPMSIKGGVVEILENLDQGKILLVYSGGLHHVQAPGEWIPRIFKTIRVGFEQIDIVEYKARMREAGPDFRTNVIQDLEERLKTKCG